MFVRLTVQVGANTVARIAVVEVGAADAARSVGTIYTAASTDPTIQIVEVSGGIKQMYFRVPVTSPNAYGQWRLGGAQPLDVYPAPVVTDLAWAHGGLAFVPITVSTSTNTTDYPPFFTVEVAKITQCELPAGFEDFSNARDTMPVPATVAQTAFNNGTNVTAVSPAAVSGFFDGTKANSTPATANTSKVAMQILAGGAVATAAVSATQLATAAQRRQARMAANARNFV
jgi:hypothetical protein